jgi:hypothetical protein
MARHKEKDDEAGGVGLGVLATRKRLWRDADGNIVNARRPSYTQEGSKRRQITRADRKSSRATIKEEDVPGQSITQPAFPSPTTSRAESASSTIVVETRAGEYAQRGEEQSRKFEHENEDDMQREPQDSWLGMTGHSLPSPPNSASQHSSAQSPSPSASLGELDALYEETWSPLTHDGLPQLSSSGSGSETPSLTSSSHPSPYFGTANWGASLPQNAAQPFQTFMGAMSELPYDDIFRPEAGMYEWQTWNSQVLMSRCREEKYEPAEERKEWGLSFSGQAQEGFRRAYGLGTA